MLITLALDLFYKFSVAIDQKKDLGFGILWKEVGRNTKKRWGAKLKEGTETGGGKVGRCFSRKKYNFHANSKAKKCQIMKKLQLYSLAL